VLHPSVPTAITTIPPTPAHPLVFTDRVISTTASSLAWAHGLAGAITTAGVVIASALPAVEGITVELVLQPIVDLQPGHRWYVPTVIAGQTGEPPQLIPMPSQLVAAPTTPPPARPHQRVAHRMPPPTRQHRGLPPPTPQRRLLADLKAPAVNPMAAATTANRSC
jgi:hypothetical protein